MPVRVGAVRYHWLMLVLVDGYNVTMRDAATCTLSKEGQREALLARMRARAHEIAPSGRVIVVFDAKAELGHSSQGGALVSAVYASVADDEIVRRCSAVSGRIVVITDDLRLRARISQDVGRHVEFRDGSTLHEGAMRRAPRSDRPVARESGLPPGANKITEELKKLWLTEDD